MFRLPRFDEEDLRWRLASLLPDFPADDRDRAANSARLYRFAAGERVALATGSQGLGYIIVRGTAVFAQTRYLELLEYGRAAAGRLPEHETDQTPSPSLHGTAYHARSGNPAEVGLGRRDAASQRLSRTD